MNFLKDYRICLRFLSIGMFAVLFFGLSGCTTYRNPSVNGNLVNEKWQREIITSPDSFAKGADRWFFTGDPNSVETANRHASYSQEVSTMTVNVPNFTDLKVDGAFQVQIFGTYDHNSLTIMGPNAAVRKVVVDMHGNVLYLHHAEKATTSEMSHVIVRIGMMNLNNLSQMGCGSIEGIRIRSNSLCLSASKESRGNVYLAGDMRLHRVNHAGCGLVSVFGAKTDNLNINASGGGAVNVTGYVGINSITHSGTGDVNVIGAHANGLKVATTNKGKIGLYGDQIRVNEIRAKDKTRVYAYYVSSMHDHNINVYASHHAEVGLAGVGLTDLFVDTAGSSRFFGRYLCVENAYVRAHDQSHINVTARDKIFASATQNASVYFFGSPSMMSQFVSGNGLIIPIWSNESRRCVMMHAPEQHYHRRRSYKGEE